MIKRGAHRAMSVEVLGFFDRRRRWPLGEGRCGNERPDKLGETLLNPTAL
jgi:hypothetical protein